MSPRRTLVALLCTLLSACQCGDARTGAVRPQIEAVPASLDFGSTTPGVSVERSFILRNDSRANLTIGEVTLSGEAVSSYLVSPLETPLVVAAGGDVTVGVVYAPTAEGNHSARLVVRSDATNAPELLVPLAGTALSADPCATVSCNLPPGPCFREAGTCSGGSCTYLPKDEGTACDDGNACTQADACRSGACQGMPLACDTPPTGVCSDANTFVSYQSPGTCVADACQYTQASHPCAGGCTGNTCQTDLCIGVTCTTPPPCFTGGTCVGGSCQYQVALGASCSDGNACTVGDVCGAGGVCAGAPSSCQSPPATSCLDPQTQRSYDATGVCGAGGVCAYTSHDTACALGCSAATGRCQTGCPTGQHACNSQCVSDTSVFNCGTSCTPCPIPPNGQRTCSGTSCGISCNTGYHRCSGACVLNSSVSSCGASCTACPAPANGTATCDGTSCGVTCSAGYHLCGGLCVVNTSTTTCGTSCTTCPAPANGTATCDGTSCGFTCDTGYHPCSGACVLNTSVSSCGTSCTACPAPANGTATCDGTSCGFTCSVGYHSCGGLCVANTSTSGCGTSCTPCSVPVNGTATCNGTSCGFTCNTGSHLCAGLCVSSTSTSSCGTSCTTCPAPANATATCNGTSCGFTCNTGYHLCAGLCVSSTSTSSCGTSCTACATPTNGTATCDGTSCGVGCSPGYALYGFAGCRVTATAVQVSAAGSHTCALTTAGGVMCWGSNSSGQLGDGTGVESLYPTDVPSLVSGVTAIATGDAQSSPTCARTAAGGVKCWGRNDQGQLGDGTMGTDRLVPTDVSGLSSGVTAIAAGDYHGCALTTAGGVKCWGWNSSGAIGDGTNTRRLVPTNVSGLASGVVAISAGGGHTCALTTAGGVKCWGFNGSGQIGDGTSGNILNNPRFSPTNVSGLSSGVAAIAAGGDHTCALTVAGGVKCWGRNLHGQIGDGTSGTNRLVPTDVSGLSSGVTAIAAGADQTCALTTAGGIKCWGYNSYGQLGDGTSGTDRLVPTDVSGLATGVASISTGGQHTCAVTTTGGIRCWGFAASYQLGPDSTLSCAVYQVTCTLPLVVVSFP